MGLVLLTTMLMISLTVTQIVITQLRLSVRMVYDAAALAAADAGTERALYIDFQTATPLTDGQTFTSANLTPFNAPDSTCNSLFYTVSAEVTTSTTVTVTGNSRCAQRALQLSY